MGENFSFTAEHRPSKNIEGESISPFAEITIDQTDPVELENIVWQQFSAGLSFKPAGEYQYKRLGYNESYPLYTCSSWFQKGDSNDQKIDLTYTTCNKKCLFTGSRKGFFMHDPAWMGKETDFYVIGINPFELKHDIRQHTGTYHELEHACIVDRNLDTNLFQAALYLNKDQLPSVAMAQAYGNILANAIPSSWRKNLDQARKITSQQLMNAMSDDHNVNHAIRLFHERNSWAGGIRLQNEHKFPTGFQQRKSLGEYAKFWLTAYANSYNDSRFIKSKF